MKFAVTANVISSTILQEPYAGTHAGFEFILLPNERGFWSRIQIRKNLDNLAEYLPKMDTSKEPIEMVVNLPATIVEEAQSWMKYLESVLSLNFRVVKIEWQRAAYEWIPENEQERSLLTISGLSPHSSYQVPPIPFDPVFFNVAVLQREKLERLAIPLAFFREGLNSYEEFQYVRAYWYFYFFLEGMFSGGKSDNKQVIKQFLHSDVLKESVGFMVNSLQDDLSKRHLVNIGNLLFELGCSRKDVEVETVVWLLVHLRGRLHHFSLESTKLKGHPFNERDFESPAYLVMGICVQCFTRLFDKTFKVKRT